MLRPISPNITYVTHETAVLKGNALGDPHIRTFPVYLPPGYEDSPDKRYPVIFGLMGFTGGGIMFLNRRFGNPGYDSDLDDLIAVGMPGVIFVFPDCITSLGGSQYVNSTAVGRYQDYIVQELVPLIDSRYRTSGLRGCIGGSSGGIGSFTLAALYPDDFQAFADHSGDSAFDQCYLGVACPRQGEVTKIPIRLRRHHLPGRPSRRPDRKRRSPRICCAGSFWRKRYALFGCRGLRAGQSSSP